MQRRYTERIAIVASLCLLASLAAGCSCAPRLRGAYAPAATGEPPAGQFRAILWFVGPNGNTVPVTRRLPAGRARVWAAIDALADGPRTGDGLSPVLPQGCRLSKVVRWNGTGLPQGMVDLDFAGPYQAVSAGADAISHTLAQFSDVDAARIFVAGTPVGQASPPEAAQPMLLRPAETKTPMQFIPVQAGPRLYLAARHITDIGATTEFDAAAARLVDAAYLRAILPRGSKVNWATSGGPNGRAVLLTIELRRKKLDDSDWQTVQVAADALALTLRSIPETESVTVTVSGQDRSFSYSGPVWPNPEPD